MTDGPGDVGSTRPQVPVRRRRWLRRTLIALGALVVLVGVLVLLAPTIAGSVAPGIASKQINAMIQGKADVGGVSLSWFGEQSVGPVTVSTPDGKPVGHVKIGVSRGLWSLARAGLGWGAMDPGTITISGDADLIRHRDGSTNLQQAIAPRAAAPGAPAPAPAAGPATAKPAGVHLPPSLTATVLIDKLDVHYVDEGRPAGMPAAYVELPGITGKATITNSKTLALDLKAPMRYGASKSGPTAPGGTMVVTASADSLTDGSGLVVPEAVKIDAKADATDIAVTLADALGALDGKLVAALGDQMQASLRASGTLKDGNATVEAHSQQSRVDLAFRAADGVITTTRAGTIELNTSGATGLVPGLQKAIAPGGDLSIDMFPQVKATVDTVRIPSAAITGGLDLRGAAAHIMVETGEISGRVRTPEAIAGAKDNLQPFSIDAFHADISTTDLAQGVTVKAATAAKLGGTPAGALSVDLAASGILDSTGRPRTGMPGISGKVSLTDVSTAIAQPLVEGAGLDLPKGVGPKVDITLAASTAGASDGSIPPTNLDVQVRSAGVTADASFVMDAHSLRTRGDGASVALKSPMALAGAAARKSGLQITGDGYARATIKNVAVIMDSAGKLDPAQLAADVEATAGGVSIGPSPSAGAAPAAPAVSVPIQQVILSAALHPGAEPHIDLKGSGGPQGSEFFAQAIMDIPGVRELLAAASAGTPVSSGAMQLRPVGSVELRNFPMSLATMTMAPPAQGSPDTRQLIQQAVGPAVTVKADIAARAGAEASARDLALSVRSDRVQGQASAGIDSKSLDVKGGEFTTTVTPDLAAAVLDAFGKQLQQKPRLTGPSTLKLAIAPVSVPMSGFSPQLDKAGDATVKVALAGPAVMQNLMLAAEQGKPARDIGPVGVRDVLITATAPLSSLAPGSPARPAKVDVAATLLGDQQQAVGTIEAGAETSLASGAPSGPIKTRLSLDVVNTPKLDAILGKPGLVSGAVGERVKIDASANVEFAKSDSAGAAAAPSALQSLDIQASITSPRLNTTKPLSLVSKGDTASLTAPAVLKWTVDPAWANSFLPPPAQPNQPPLLRVTEATDVTISLSKLSLALGAQGGPLKAGVFAADGQITAPAAKLSVSGQPAAIKNLLARAASGREPNVLGFTLRADDMGGGPAPGGGPALDFEGGLYGIADAAGNPTFGAAKVSGTGNAVGVPTAIIDAAAAQNGLLVQALGPAVTVKLQATGASAQGGVISADTKSARAEASVRGAIHGGSFVSDGPVTATLHEVTPELGARLVKGLPMIGTFQKKTTDAPATLKATALTVPLDNQLAKLNGVVVVDPGEAEFTTSTVFTALLKLVKQKDSGSVGKKLQPLTVTIKNGVATYDKYALPLGEFNVTTQGTVDLVQKKLDVLTYVPFGALTDEVAGSLNSGIGKVIGGALPTIEKATMVPLRTTGTFEKNQTRPDLELFLKETGKTLLRPDQLLGGSVEDLLNKVKKPKK